MSGPDDDAPEQGPEKSPRDDAGPGAEGDNDASSAEAGRRGAIASARAFRAILEAIARPGRPQALPEPPAPPTPLSPAAAQIALTLSDVDARLWLTAPLRTTPIERFLRFETGAAPVSDPRRAAFAIGRWADLEPRDLAALPVGEAEYPDRAATLVIELDALSPDPIEGFGAALRGPGIDGALRLWAAGAPPEFWGWARENAARFPLGLDLFLTAGDRIVGLPRSTVIEAL